MGPGAIGAWGQWHSMLCLVARAMAAVIQMHSVVSRTSSSVVTVIATTTAVEVVVWGESSSASWRRTSSLPPTSQNSLRITTADNQLDSIKITAWPGQ